MFAFIACTMLTSVGNIVIVVISATHICHNCYGFAYNAYYNNNKYVGMYVTANSAGEKHMKSKQVYL